MDNLTLYNKVRSVPTEAKKEILAGRLKGKTDINPMWRIKTLTEQFGMCGIGWVAPIVRTWLDEGADGEEIANVEILLKVKVDGAWSEGITGIGGSMFISNERSGKYTDDDCYKKAYTDAISVACKSLGVGADVYYSKDTTKYDARNGENPQKPTPPPQAPKTPQNAPFVSQRQAIANMCKQLKLEQASIPKLIFELFGKQLKADELSTEQFEQLKLAMRTKVQ